jgi:hypothetical protein
MKLYKSKKLLNIDNNPKTIKGQKSKSNDRYFIFSARQNKRV